MPLPRWIAVVNKRFTNRFIEPFVRRFKHYAVVHHVGRVSGSSYRTPVYAFAGRNHWYIALTYGPEADWVRNVMTEGGSIRFASNHQKITAMTLVGRDEAWHHLPLLVRVFLRLLRVRDFACIEHSHE
jgi:deazaflavin-dependent oxidoreductase (nitroreductase family)